MLQNSTVRGKLVWGIEAKNYPITARNSERKISSILGERLDSSLLYKFLGGFPDTAYSDHVFKMTVKVKKKKKTRKKKEEKNWFQFPVSLYGIRY